MKNTQPVEDLINDIHLRAIYRKDALRTARLKNWGSFGAVLLSGAFATALVASVVGRSNDTVNPANLDKVVECAMPIVSVDAYGSPVNLSVESFDRALVIAQSAVSGCIESTKSDIGLHLNDAVDEVLHRSGVINLNNLDNSDD